MCTGAENLVHTGIRSPDRPARSESLYRLRYPAPVVHSNNNESEVGLGIYAVGEYAL